MVLICVPYLTYALHLVSLDMYHSPKLGVKNCDSTRQQNYGYSSHGPLCPCPTKPVSQKHYYVLRLHTRVCIDRGTLGDASKFNGYCIVHMKNIMMCYVRYLKIDVVP